MNPTRFPAWPILLLTLLTVAFFVGGVYLELEGADHGLKKISERFGNDPAMLKEVVAFQTDRVARIHTAAAAALDLAKIGLGAIVALATQFMTSGKGAGLGKDA